MFHKSIVQIGSNLCSVTDKNGMNKKLLKLILGKIKPEIPEKSTIKVLSEGTHLFFGAN